MKRRERDKQVVEEMALNFGFDPNNDEKVLNMPDVVKQLNKYAQSPKIVVSFLYDVSSGQVILTTPNIPPEPKAFRVVSEGCMEAAKQYSKIAQQVADEQEKWKDREVGEAAVTPVDVEEGLLEEGGEDES
jgi:hypothetical protein